MDGEDDFPLHSLIGLALLVGLVWIISMFGAFANV